ncbi:MAG: hypothetical protein AAGJ11_15610 [Bacteroidota bacterium]
MRPLRLGAVLLAASGLAGCAASGPPALPEAGSLASGRLVGEWASVDTTAQTFTTGDGDVVGVRTLLMHLSISDSTWTETRVVDGIGSRPTGYNGGHVTYRYRLAGDSLVFGVAPDDLTAGTVSIQDDTLSVEIDVSQGEVTHYREVVRQRFVRSEPLRIPPEIVGFWTGVSKPDAAGVPAGIAFRFHADGTLENGWGETEGAFVVAGPYLLLQARYSTNIARMELDPAVEVEPGVTTSALRLYEADGDEGPLILYRR